MQKKHSTRTRVRNNPSLLTFTRTKFRALFLAAFFTGAVSGMSLALIIVIGGNS